VTTFVIIVGLVLLLTAVTVIAFLVAELRFMRLEERALESFDRATRKFMLQQEYLSVDDRARFFDQLDSFRAGRA
jgi:hypothetical protein